MSLTASSQDIVIKRSALESMYKESRICDSLRARYNEKSEVLNTLIESNERTTLMLSENRIKLDAYNDKINKLNKDLSKKKRNVLFYGVGGVAIGIIVKSLIN